MALAGHHRSELEREAAAHRLANAARQGRDLARELRTLDSLLLVNKSDEAGYPRRPVGRVRAGEPR
jgi:hypothetical protein